MSRIDPKVVAIGGGHGLSRVLVALRHLHVAPIAVVTVADDGGSSGRLRRDLGIVALGDLRMALLALARDDALAETLAHRFHRGHLEGHALGNLVLVALSERADGDVLAALRRAEALLRCQGSVLPSTTVPVHISARVSGRQVEGQANITRSEGWVEALRLEPPDAAACPDAVAAVRDADVVILGPGSLYTSVMVHLLVDDLCRAVRETDAMLVHVANVQATPGESSHLSLDDHVVTLQRALGGRTFDAVVAHDGPRPAGRGPPLPVTAALSQQAHVVSADLLGRDGTGQVTRTHDDRRLARALATVLRTRVTTTATPRRR